MNRRIAYLLIGAVALAASACARHPYREEQPHHYTTDRYGNELACYPMESSDPESPEYECLQEGADYRGPYAWDPWWPSLSLGLYYGWSYPYNFIIIDEPVVHRRPPAPPPRRPQSSRGAPSRADAPPARRPERVDRNPPSYRRDRRQ